MRTKNDLYLRFNAINNVLKNDLESYWDRKNKFVIVKFEGDEQCLVFLVADVEKPQVPGYPACGIEYFNSHSEAVDAIKKRLGELKYEPMYQEYGFYSKKGPRHE